MRKALVAAAALSLAGVAWRVHHHHVIEPAPAAQLVQDRLWIDHLPHDDRDKAKVFIALSEESTGVFHTGSSWQGNFDLFRFEAAGAELRVVFPQTGEREQLRVTTRECHEDGMDYCLDVSGSKYGATRYYSRKKWVIKTREAEAALLASLTPAGT